MTIKGI